MVLLKLVTALLEHLDCELNSMPIMHMFTIHDVIFSLWILFYFT